MAFVLHDEIKYSIAQVIKEVADKEFNTDLDLTNLYNGLTTPPDRKLGDVAFACFPLAKELKSSPVQISGKLQELILESEYINKAVATGPYLNISLNFKNTAKTILTSINTETYFKKDLTKNAPKTMIEYSQPNTHKELHVGHMRNLCMGSALIHLLRYANVETIATTFPGDVGTHVAKCLWFLKKHNKEEVPKTRKGAWLGAMYSRAHNLLEDEKGTEKEDQNRAELTEILKQLERKSGEYFDLWLETRQWSIDLMNDVYKWAHVEFDIWYWESEVDSDSVKLAMEYFEKGLFIKDDGAIGCDLSNEKLGFCLLIKSDGNGLYATKDIELARRKFKDYQIEKNLYVVDKRQERHFKQVFATLKKMGFENADKCEHIQYDFVELPDGAMSSRKGNIIPLQSLIDQMQSMIKEKYLSRYKDEWSETQIEETAHIVAEGAIKFGMTRIDNNKKIVFDMEEWLKLDGESGPYIQYVYARINSMLNKLGRVDASEVKFEVLAHKLEEDLILKLIDFNNAVENAVKNYKTSPVTSYLFELAKTFNSFYAECSVANAESEDLKKARLYLCEAVSLTLKNGLAVLGITAPKQM